MKTGILITKSRQTNDMDMPKFKTFILFVVVLTPLVLIVTIIFDPPNGKIMAGLSLVIWFVYAKSLYDQAPEYQSNQVRKLANTIWRDFFLFVAIFIYTFVSHILILYAAFYPGSTVVDLLNILGYEKILDVIREPSRGVVYMINFFLGVVNIKIVMRYERRLWRAVDDFYGGN
jgi:hypothetical protein